MDNSNTSGTPDSSEPGWFKRLDNKIINEIRQRYPGATVDVDANGPGGSIEVSIGGAPLLPNDMGDVISPDGSIVGHIDNNGNIVWLNNAPKPTGGGTGGVSATPGMNVIAAIVANLRKVYGSAADVVEVDGEIVGDKLVNGIVILGGSGPDTPPPNEQKHNTIYSQGGQVVGHIDNNDHITKLPPHNPGGVKTGPTGDAALGATVNTRRDSEQRGPSNDQIGKVHKLIGRLGNEDSQSQGSALPGLQKPSLGSPTHSQTEQFTRQSSPYNPHPPKPEGGVMPPPKEDLMAGPMTHPPIPGHPKK